MEPAVRPSRKVPAKSHGEWMKLVATAAATSAPPTRHITMAELAEHGKAEDAWTAIRGVVYNVTQYLDYHPGGRAQLLRAVGKDGTDLFDLFHRYVNVDVMLQPFAVGLLQQQVPLGLGPAATGGVGAGGAASSGSDARPLLRRVRWAELPIHSLRQEGGRLHVRFAVPHGMVLGLPPAAVGLGVSLRIPHDLAWASAQAAQAERPLYPAHPPPGDDILVQPVWAGDGSHFEITCLLPPPPPAPASAAAAAAAAADAADATGVMDDEDAADSGSSSSGRLAAALHRLATAGRGCFLLLRGPTSYLQWIAEDAAGSEGVHAALAGVRLPPAVASIVAASGVALAQGPAAPIAAWLAPSAAAVSSAAAAAAAADDDGGGGAGAVLRGVPISSVCVLLAGLDTSLLPPLLHRLSSLHCTAGSSAGGSGSAGNTVTGNTAAAAPVPVPTHILWQPGPAVPTDVLQECIAQLAPILTTAAGAAAQVSVLCDDAHTAAAAAASAAASSHAHVLRCVHYAGAAPDAALLQATCKVDGGRWWPAPDAGTVVFLCGPPAWCEAADRGLRSAYYLPHNTIPLQPLPCLLR